MRPDGLTISPQIRAQRTRILAILKGLRYGLLDGI